MSKRSSSARAALDAWREQHADRLDPVRFRVIDAMAARAAGAAGELRRILENRLAELLEAYAVRLEAAPGGAAVPAARPRPGAPGRGALGGLLNHLARHGAARGNMPGPDDAAPDNELPPLEVLDRFRSIWSRVRTGSQVRQSLEQVPADAGPLNSGALVHRSIALMQEASPQYLQHFLSYVDALSWMEQINYSGGSPGRDSPQAANPARRTRSRPRTRRG